MQAPRNWRNKIQRYRLTGVQYANGANSLINRPQTVEPQTAVETETEEMPVVQVTAA